MLGRPGVVSGRPIIYKVGEMASLNKFLDCNLQPEAVLGIMVVVPVIPTIFVLVPLPR